VTQLVPTRNFGLQQAG